ncbi:sulfatase-like hydrolase/transferase [Acidobacteria bacterium AH-259-A15]|nr:sulfatase-like hydrolase/transferase [Acidobacteria bacterium AH-259-A15]
MGNKLKRRDFMQLLGTGLAATSLPQFSLTAGSPQDKPNIILSMSDDQGWGDTGANGHPLLKTPNLDAIAENGIHFKRFYSGAPVCSPTRGSCITGRHPYRYGIFSANVGHMPKEEVTLAEVLKTQGYATGHFGKWHLGTLTTKVKESNRGGPRGAKNYSPPWENGFDVCFSTEAKVPTWNPMIMPKGKIRGAAPEGAGQPYGTHYWLGPDKMARKNLEGDDSRVIMDRALPFIENAVKQRKAFLAVIWFHTPHAPVVAGPKYRKMYENLSVDEQHYYGCISAMDEQMGRLRKALRDLGVADNTMVWFCSDNGPEGDGTTGRSRGSAGPFRGRKRSLLEGGVRVPGILEWPAIIKTSRVVETPCSTLDYFPTVLDVLGFKIKGQPEPMDGVSLLPLIEGNMKARPVPIAFQSRNQVSLTDNRYKIYSDNDGETYTLFDLIEDPGETKDLSSEKPEIVRAMRGKLEIWRASCKASLGGHDYKISS